MNGDSTPSTPAATTMTTTTTAAVRAQSSIPATYYRGGSSRGVLFSAADLPSSRAEQTQIFLSVLGSPDPSGRQLNGLGAGISSLSKVAVLGPSTDRARWDVEYTFVAVGIDKAECDWSANCGNLTSAVGPWAVENGLLLRKSHDDEHEHEQRGHHHEIPDGEVCVRILNTNTNKVVHSTFEVKAGEYVVNGDFELEGVAGTGAPIKLDFMNPGGAKTGKLLPTGNAVDEIELDLNFEDDDDDDNDGDDQQNGSASTTAISSSDDANHTTHTTSKSLTKVKISVIDAVNPVVFIHPSSLGISGTESPLLLHTNTTFNRRVEAIRRRAAVLMGLVSHESATPRAVPKVSVVSAPVRSRLMNGHWLEAKDVDIVVRAVSDGMAHRALPISLALCTAAAAGVKGSLVEEIVEKDKKKRQEGEGNGIKANNNNTTTEERETPKTTTTITTTSQMTIGHPSGKAVVSCEFDAQGTLTKASVIRTARKLMQGQVFWNPTSSSS